LRFVCNYKNKKNVHAKNPSPEFNAKIYFYC
jgi:hypothetical protein